MIVADILEFPPRHVDVLAERVRAAMLVMADSADMMAYIQGALPALLPHLGRIVLDSTFNPAQGLFSVYLYGDLPGMPLLFRGKCLKSCLIGCAQRLCRMPSTVSGSPRPIEGFSPVYVRSLAEFRAKS